MREPVLRQRVYVKGHVLHRITVYGGLHYIQGNDQPYFTLTADIDLRASNGRWVDDCCGQCHDQILFHFPDLADLAAMHLSGMDGQPMYAEANGWYWLAGALGGIGERYHGGNSEPPRTKTECLETWARYCRIPLGWPALISLAIEGAPNPREAWRSYIEVMKPHWAREAQECIEKHKLMVFGDPWKRSTDDPSDCDDRAPTANRPAPDAGTAP